MIVDKYDIKDLINEYGEDYIKENLDNFKEWLEQNEDFIEANKDNEAYKNDPEGFYGVSRRD